MGNADRPALTLSQEIVIEAAQNDVDNMFWQGLWEFQVLMPHVQLEYDQRRTSPPAPKEPAKFQWIVGEYARNLFIIEARVYPDALELEKWLKKLSEKVMERVSQKLDEIEDRGQLQGRSFIHHGVTPDQIFSAMHDVLASAIETRLARSQPISLPLPPPEVTTQMQSQPPASTKAAAVQDVQPNESEVERRRKLLAEYKAATGNPPDMHIYLASNSGIHKPEFYQWRNGRMPATSRVTKRFEAFLKAKKRPIPKNPTNL